MPSLGMMTINALACADSVLIPVQAAYLPVKGLQQLIKTIGRVKKQLNPKLKIEGINNHFMEKYYTDLLKMPAVKSSRNPDGDKLITAAL